MVCDWRLGMSTVRSGLTQRRSGGLPNEDAVAVRIVDVKLAGGHVRRIGEREHHIGFSWRSREADADSAVAQPSCE